MALVQPVMANDYGTLAEVQEEARRRGARVLVEIVADYCPACHKMDKTTFKDPQVKTLLSEKVILYKVNIKDFEGVELATTYAVTALPHFLVFDQESAFEMQFSGFQSAERLVDRLDFKIVPPLPNMMQYGILMGTFDSANEAFDFADQHRSRFFRRLIILKEDDREVFGVLVTSFSDASSAEEFLLQELKPAGFNGFIQPLQFSN